MNIEYVSHLFFFFNPFQKKKSSCVITIGIVIMIYRRFGEVTDFLWFFF